MSPHLWKIGEHAVLLERVSSFSVKGEQVTVRIGHEGVVYDLVTPARGKTLDDLIVEYQEAHERLNAHYRQEFPTPQLEQETDKPDWPDSHELA